jgi:HK97 family phage portal protein
MAIETLGGLIRNAGHEMRSWSGPGDIRQWPQLADMGYVGAGTMSGEYVSEQNALKRMAVFASVRILSMIDAALPVHLYRDLDTGGKEKATTDYRYRLVHDQPNDEMTAALFRMYMRQNKSLWGNAYAWIKWNGGNNHAEEIWPLRPDWMTVFRTKAGQKVYHYDPPDGIRAGYYSPAEILHFRNLGDDLTGYSPIRMFREDIGHNAAAAKASAAFFRNGARMSGVLTVEGKVKPGSNGEDSDAERTFNEKFAGAHNQGKVLVIGSGSKFVSTTIPPEDAQYLATMQFTGGEISTKVYGIPPHLTGDTEKQTSWGTGVEQMSIGFVTYTLMPDFVLQEAEWNMKLLGGGVYCKYSLAALLRADAKSRAEAFQIMRRNGALSADEWREFEELNPIPGGDKYAIEANMTTLEKLGQEPAAPVQVKQ